MRIKTTLLAACAVALIAPAASQAATRGMEGNTLVYKGEGSEGNSLLLSSYQDWAPARPTCASPTAAPTAFRSTPASARTTSTAATSRTRSPLPPA